LLLVVVLTFITRSKHDRPTKKQGAQNNQFAPLYYFCFCGLRYEKLLFLFLF